MERVGDGETFDRENWRWRELEMARIGDGKSFYSENWRWREL